MKPVILLHYSSFITKNVKDYTIFANIFVSLPKNLILTT